jgi:polysaccharide pyruvyl transferase WcaK-like protein
MFGCGVGPVSKPLNRWLAGHIINRSVTAVTLREDLSEKELRSMGVTRPSIRLSADPVLTLSAKPALPLPAERCICFILRPWSGVERALPAFAAAAEYAFGKYGLTPVFFAIDPVKDAPVNLKVAELLTCPHFVADAVTDPQEAIGYIAQMSAVVSMRLHGLIFAAANAVPLVGVVYDPKVNGFMDYIGESNYLPLGEVNAASLCAAIDAALDEVKVHSAKDFGGGVERIRELEKVNREVLRQLIE